MIRRVMFLALLFYPVVFCGADALGRGNRCPIILVGGFMNFGRDKALGFKYWGGTDDFQGYLEEKGFTVYTVDIGPLSSNRDRACELFAELKGGRVDYGAAHAEEFGHERYGKSCPGFYPEWGTPDPETGKIRKVHLLCHSMGGQTARVLARLLEEGDDGEKARVGEGLSPLFSGGRKWIESITTIATPHNGTTLTRTAPLVENYVVQFVSLLDMANDLVSGSFFDFQLNHWGIFRREGQSVQEFQKSLKESRLWFSTEDFSFYDLTPEGAEVLNTQNPACGDVYYFSWSTLRTQYDTATNRVQPDIGIGAMLLPGALYIGNYEIPPEDPDWITPLWRMNDGVVNTLSMQGPRAGSVDRIVPFGGKPERGVWNDMGVLSSCDHLEVLGISALPFVSPLEGYTALRDWYLDWASFLWSLE